MTVRSFIAEAACRGLDTELFFPAGAAEIPPEAQEACASCRARTRCLEYALETSQAGVWGGMSEKERHDERRRRQRRAAAARAREEDEAVA